MLFTEMTQTDSPAFDVQLKLEEKIVQALIERLGRERRVARRRRESRAVHSRAHLRRSGQRRTRYRQSRANKGASHAPSASTSWSGCEPKAGRVRSDKVSQWTQFRGDQAGLVALSRLRASEYAATCTLTGIETNLDRGQRGSAARWPAAGRVFRGGCTTVLPAGSRGDHGGRVHSDSRDRPGSLAGLGRVLGDARVNIEPIHGNACETSAIVQFVPNDQDKAAHALDTGGTAYSIRDVLIVGPWTSRARSVMWLSSCPRQA